MAKKSLEEATEKRHKQGFWNIERMFLLFIFLLGVIIGAMFTHQYVEPALNSKTMSDYNSTLLKNKVLDRQLDFSRQCLEKFNIDYEGCKRKE